MSLSSNASRPKPSWHSVSSVSTSQRSNSSRVPGAYDVERGINVPGRGRPTGFFPQAKGRSKRGGARTGRLTTPILLCLFVLVTGAGLLSLYHFRKLPGGLASGNEAFMSNKLVRVPPPPERAVQKPQAQSHQDGLLSRAFLELSTSQDGVAAYQAGLPHFPRVFARDSIATALLMDNAAMLRRILVLCATHLGKNYDRRSGEEPGKVFHELPGVRCTWCNGQDGRTNELNTAYNAIDTTPLFVVAAARYFELVGDRAFLAQQRVALKEAMRFIKRHSNDGLYHETPRHIEEALGGEVHFALPVTYWKDSALNGRPNGAPVYPVTYTLVQAQALAAVRGYQGLQMSCPSCVEIDGGLHRLERSMLRGLRRLLGDGVVAHDLQGDITVPSSDLLHALWYMDVGDLHGVKGGLQGLATKAEGLATPEGFTASAHAPNGDRYHGRVVWPFEQAFIHAAARRFRLRGVELIANRAASALASRMHQCQEGTGAKGALVRQLPGCFPERLGLAENTANAVALGPSPQLWTLAAVVYFARLKNSMVHRLGLRSRPGGPFGVSPDVYAHYRKVSRKNPGRSLLRHMGLRAKMRKHRAAVKGHSRSEKLARHHMLCLNGEPPIDYQSDGTSQGCQGTSCLAAINDDYCECSDGSDEPGTAACEVESDLFFCSDGGGLIHRSLIGDGVCDCCDGSDEQARVASRCPYSCKVDVVPSTYSGDVGEGGWALRA